MAIDASAARDDGKVSLRDVDYASFPIKYKMENAEINFKSKQQFLDEFMELKERDIIHSKMWFGKGKRIYKLHARKDNDNTVMHLITCHTETERNNIMGLYVLLKETKILNIYDIYKWPKPRDFKPRPNHTINEFVSFTSEELSITLEDYIESKYKNNGQGIKEIECKSIIKDLMQKLSILHESGHIHRDIKVENIMMNDKGKWNLIDFEGALFIGDKEFVKREGVSCSTFLWMPPEVKGSMVLKEFKSKEERQELKESDEMDYYNFFSYGMDIWQMGLVILYIITGKHYFELTTWEATKCDFLPFHKNNFGYFYETKLLQNGGYEMDSDRNKGEISLRNYLISLYYVDKISKNLFSLLHDDLLVFDPRKRAKCRDILNHPWFAQ